MQSENKHNGTVYKLRIGPKTRLFNLFRQVFRFRPFEKLLAKNISHLNIDRLWVRMMPPNYLYPKNSRREVVRNGINYDLDISDYVEHAVYFGYQDKAQKELFSISENKKVIIDVGVNIGAVLLNFSRLSPEGTIFGFEPDEKNFQKATRNLALNTFDNVTIIRKGLGSETSTVKLYKVNEDNEGMNRILNDAELRVEQNFPYTKIEIIRLDDFVEESSLERIDLIKIDVEGYELNVLKGAERSIRKFSPALFIELDDDNLQAQNGSARSLVLFVKRIGYDIIRADNRQPLSGDEDFSNCHFDIICRKSPV